MNLFRTITVALFITLSSTYGQESEYMFKLLQIHDTIKSQKIIDRIKSKDAVKSTSFFFTQKYNDQEGLFFIEKKGKYWLVYNYDEHFISNYSVNKHKAHSNRYVSIDVGVVRSGMGENNYSWFVLFDLENKAYLVVQNFSYNSGEYDNGVRFEDQCSSEIKYDKGYLIVNRKCNVKKEDINYCSYCIETGKYKITADKLIKQ